MHEPRQDRGGPAIALEGLTKSFGDTHAVRDLDLRVPAASILGFIGPNGAGKTTTIRMIMSILFPDRGRLEVLGKASALEAKDRIGYLPEERGLYKKMPVAKFLRYLGVLKGVGGPELGGRVSRWLERMGLAEVAGKRCEDLSKGMQQKVQYVAAVIHRPELLILDEPFSGLDPMNMRLLRDLILEEHRRGTTILFSTHVMHQAEQLCERVVMLHRGRKVMDDRLADLRTRYEPRAVLLEPLEPGADPRPLAELPPVAGIARADDAWRLELHPGTELGPLMREIVARVPPSRLEVHRPSLEDMFVELVRGAGPDGEGEVPP